MQIDMPPTRHRAVLDCLQYLLPTLGILLLPDPVRQIEVVPADDGVLDQASAPLGNFLFHLFAVQELVVVTERDRLRELIGIFTFVELLFDCLSKLHVINDAQNKIRFWNFAELFERLIQRVLFGVGVEPSKELRSAGLLELNSGNEA